VKGKNAVKKKGFDELLWKESRDSNFRVNCKLTSRFKKNNFIQFNLMNEWFIKF
jgi:hypothetical protein